MDENIDSGETTACNLAQTEHMQARHRVVPLRGESESKSNEFPPAPNAAAAGAAGGGSVAGGRLVKSDTCRPLSPFAMKFIPVAKEQEPEPEPEQEPEPENYNENQIQCLELEIKQLNEKMLKTEMEEKKKQHLHQSMIINKLYQIHQEDKQKITREEEEKRFVINNVFRTIRMCKLSTVT